MSTMPMKIRPFSITEGGERVLEVLQGVLQRDPVLRNLPTKAGGYVRIDNITKGNKAPAGETTWLMNFVRNREGHGPVKISRAQDAVKPIDYAEDESPGEEIAALLIPATNHLLVHVVQHFRIGTIRDYINMVVEAPLCNMEVVSDDETYRKFVAAESVKKVAFGLDTRAFTSAEHRAGMSTGAVLDLANRANASIVEVKFSAKGDDVLNADTVEAAAEMLAAYQQCKQAATPSKSGVKKLEVAVLDPDQKMEVLNLLTPMLEREYNLPLDKGRRFPLHDRYEALQMAYAAWRTILRNMRPPTTSS